MQDEMKSRLQACTAEQRGCVAAAANIIGTKWTPQILYALASGAQRFSEIQKEIDGLNPRTLSARLEELKLAGIITRISHGQFFLKMAFSLSRSIVSDVLV